MLPRRKENGSQWLVTIGNMPQQTGRADGFQSLKGENEW